MSDSILQVNQIKDKGGNAVGITVADSTANISIGTTLAVNTINEATSANGVTIDGLSLKDGNVVPAAGKGIDFSAQTPTGVSGASVDSGGEVLDHYEEGEWQFSSEGGSVVAGAKMGRYTRIGNLVTITGQFQQNKSPEVMYFSSNVWCLNGYIHRAPGCASQWSVY